MLRHLDTTLDTGALEPIAALSASSRPADLGGLCHALAIAASKATH